VPGAQGNHYAVAFAGDANVRKHFAEANTGGRTVDSMEQLSQMINKAYRDAKTEKKLPLDGECDFICTDGRNIFGVTVGGNL
jgi:hypothetical protein